MEVLSFKADWTYERYVNDRTREASRAQGDFYIEGDRVYLTPRLYAVDAKTSGGSSKREFTVVRSPDEVSLLGKDVRFRRPDTW